MIPRSALVGFVALCLGVILGASGGIYAEQRFPQFVPPFPGTSTTGMLDSRPLDQALRVIRANYYDNRLDYKQLSQGTVRGLVEGLNDPYSEYLDASQFRRQENSYAGRYTGIGIYVDFKSDYPVITGVIPESPAQQSGLKANDSIVAVNGKDAKGLKASAAAAEIQGPDGSTVKLTIARGGQRLDFSIRRAHIKLPFVRSHVFGSVLYMRIFSFGTEATSEFDSALNRDLARTGSIVLDLRGNPGGFVEAADDVISRFVDSGVAFEIQDRSGHVETNNVTGAHTAATKPLVVLVDGDSASAAEIVAGSLQVHHRAQLVGTKTFGKGSVQQDFPLFDGSDLHLTIRHWLLPNGASVDKTGLRPDVNVQLPNSDAMYQVDVPGASPAADKQLAKALQLLGA